MKIALFLIRSYQRHLSPRKGFRCAHAAVHGGPSCSEYCAEQIALQGTIRGALAMRSRFRECRVAAMASGKGKNKRKGKKKKRKKEKESAWGACTPDPTDCCDVVDLFG